MPKIDEIICPWCGGNSGNKAIAGQLSGYIFCNRCAKLFACAVKGNIIYREYGTEQDTEIILEPEITGIVTARRYEDLWR